jgi:hypothetical protein
MMVEDNSFAIFEVVYVVGYVGISLSICRC